MENMVGEVSGPIVMKYETMIDWAIKFLYKEETVDHWLKNTFLIHSREKGIWEEEKVSDPRKKDDPQEYLEYLMKKLVLWDNSY